MAMTDNRENTLNKIRALLSKTMENGCTEEEHLAALNKARAFMDAYEVTDADLQLAKEEGAIFRKEPPGTKDPHLIKSSLVEAVAKFTDCRAWRENRTAGAALVFCGLPSDARFATWLLDHLANFVKAELAEFLMRDHRVAGERRAVINGFVIGATDRISYRLRELCKPTASVRPTANNNALVVVKQAAIKAKLEEAGICLRSGRGSRRAYDEGSIAAGSSAGDRATFGRPVSGQAAALRIGSR
jgi:hypothetical protein